MSLELIQKGLINKLTTTFASWQTAHRIAWENVVFDPSKVPGLAWMRATFMPASEMVGSLGANGLDKNEGLFQIDVNYPEGVGEAASRTTINELHACYKPGSFIYSGQQIAILNRFRGPAMTTEGFYKIPFTVRWRAHLLRSS